MPSTPSSISRSRINVAVRPVADISRVRSGFRYGSALPGLSRRSQRLREGSDKLNRMSLVHRIESTSDRPSLKSVLSQVRTLTIRADFRPTADIPNFAFES